MLKIYDCSNSSESYHGKNIGPVENDIIRGLKEYAYFFSADFVNDFNSADVVITNDIFPKEIKNSNIPKIKRMDGIFWNNNLKFRNIELNESAEIADEVIFISHYSKTALYTLYPEIKLKSSSIVLNAADNNIFPFKINKNKNIEIFGAVATNWERDVKRFNSLVALGERIKEKIYLVGQCNQDVPENIIKFGYCEKPSEINEILQKCDAFINLSYRDAAPKVVCQASSIGLPILYADSGGVSEIANNGVPILDEKQIYFDDTVKELDIDEMLKSYYQIKENYNNLLKKPNNNYLLMLEGYFKVINKYKS